MLEKIHHINFVVRNLDAAIRKYENVFQVCFTHRDSLPDRAVETARFRLGETWIVLVQPTTPDSVVGRYLEERGEGFFLISYQVNDIAKSVEQIKKNGAKPLHSIPRAGLEDWQVVDLDPLATCGVLTQIVESRIA